MTVWLTCLVLGCSPGDVEATGGASEAVDSGQPSGSTGDTASRHTATTATTGGTSETGALGGTAMTGETADTAASLPPLGPGTWHEQSLDVDGEERVYLVHVPGGYDGSPMPLLMDFHGTATSVPEEAYGLAAAIDTADDEGFVLVRPRSRSSAPGGYEVYRWDQNPGDPQRNLDFSLALLDKLDQQLALDHDRLYAMGFSSGTNQTAMLAEDPASPFDGFGYVGGGAWHTTQQEADGRVYLATPYRDYMRIYHHELVRQLDEAGHPAADRYERVSMSGHELYDGMYPELWAWLDRGEAPDADGPLAAGWTEATAPPALAADKGPDGRVWLAGDTLSTWDGVAVTAPMVTGTAFHGSPTELTGVCLTEGVGAAVGNGAVLWSDDGGASFVHVDPVSEPGPPMFGYAHWTGVGCASGMVRGVGYWSAGATTDGQGWSDVALTVTGYRAQALATAADPYGHWATVGYYRYLAVDEVPEPLFSLGRASWITDVTTVPGTADGDSVAWVAVGDTGTMLRSADGDAWATVATALTSDDELSAVAFRGDGVGLAVGRAGVALRTDDGGMSWTSVPLGRHVLLADVVWLDDGDALVVGPSGSYRYEP